MNHNQMPSITIDQNSQRLNVDDNDSNHDDLQLSERRQKSIPEHDSLSNVDRTSIVTNRKEEISNRVSPVSSNDYVYKRTDTLQLRRNYHVPVLNLQIPTANTLSSLSNTVYHDRIPSPTLYRYCMDDSYHSMIPSYCSLHPIDIQWFDRYGNCPLHILCQKKPNITTTSTTRLSSNAANNNFLYNAINAIIKVCPECIAWPNSLTWTPYHYLINEYILASQQYASNRSMMTKPNNDETEDDSNVEVNGLSNNELNGKMNHHSYYHKLMINLLQACPDVVFQTIRSGYQQNNFMKTLFHYACHANVPHDVLYEMLCIHPNLVTGCNNNSSNNKIRHQSNHTTTTTTKEMNPLFLLWDSYKKNPTMCSIEQMDKKMQLLLCTMYYGSIIDDLLPSVSKKSTNDNIIDPNNIATKMTTNIIHIVCCISCPKEYIFYVMRQYKQFIMQQDEYGEYPLHYAVGKRSRRHSAYLNSEVIVDATYQQFMIETILSSCREAASLINTIGQLPLHIALSSSSSSSSSSSKYNDNDDNGSVISSVSSSSEYSCNNNWMKSRTYSTWHWNHGGIRELTYAYIDALQQPDPITGLVPFLLATATFTNNIHNNNHIKNHSVTRYQRDQNDVLSTIYELLVAAPEMLQQQRRRSSLDDDACKKIRL